MTYVALFRNGRDLRYYRMCQESDVERLLLPHAHAGDTLHKVPEEFTLQAADVTHIIEEQLAQGPGHYVQI